MRIQLAWEQADTGSRLRAAGERLKRASRRYRLTVLMFLAAGALPSIPLMVAQDKPVAADTLSQNETSQDYGPHLSWEGTLRGHTSISVHAWDVEVRGSGPNNVGSYRYRISLPLSDSLDQDAALVIHSGNRIRVAQQPRGQNQHTAIVQIDASEARHVSFDLLYHLYPHSWFDAPTGWWNPRDVVHWQDGGADA